MKDLFWNIKVIIRQRRCVRCGKLLFGEAEGVNVYDKVVGRHLGVKCGKPCMLKEGTPEWVKLYWIKHFLSVIYQPDWFSKHAYKEAWKSNLELVKDFRIVSRVTYFPLTKIMEKKYPNKWDKP